MTGEGSEYGGRRREIDEDETDRIVREIIDEVRKETEERETSEVKEGHDESKNPEQCVREAIEEIRQEEAERLRARGEREEREREKEERLEESREEREERADKDDFAELEERILENFDSYDIDPEEVKERWRERFEEEVEKQLDGTKNESEKTDTESNERAGDEGRTVEGDAYYTDSSGQVHVVKTESDENAENKVESLIEVQAQQEEPAETSDTHEGQGAEPRAEEGEVTPQDEHSFQTQEGAVEHPHARESEERTEEVERQSPETESKEVTPERERTTEGPDNPHPETKVSSPEIDTEHRPAKEHQRQESERTSETDTSTEESKEDAESREEEIWRSYELENGSVEDEEWKRYLREVFNAISEEEREAFKEYLREKVQSIEDFEELLRKYGLEELLDEADVMQEVRQFLELMQALKANPEGSVEDIAKNLDIDVEQALEWSRGESEPTSLKKLLNLEAYYLWDQIIRDYRERDFPKTEEELERALAEHSELRSGRFLSIERDEALAWIEITGMRRRGEIEKKIRNGREIYYRKQMTELSEKHGISVQEIVRWLRGERVPTLIERTGRVVTTRRKEEMLPKEIDVKEVHRLYFEQGLSMPETARRLGSKSTKPVRRVFKEQGWKPRPPGFQRPSVDLNEIHRLYFVEGWNLREIARKVRMDRHTIGKIFREQGWETRRTAAIGRMRSIDATAKNSHSDMSPKTIEINPSDVYQFYVIGNSTLKETAERLGLMTTRPIRRILKNHGWDVKPTERIDLDEMYRLHVEEGLSLGKIAKTAGLTASIIRKAFKQRGWKTRRIRVDRVTPDINKVYTLYYEKGLTKEEVAEELNASESSIRKVFREMEWPSKIRKFKSEEERQVARKKARPKIKRELVKLRERIFGTKCLICGVGKSKKTLFIHKKDGAEHERGSLWRSGFLRRVDAEDWAALCPSCHAGVHWMMDMFGLGWEQIRNILQSKANRNIEQAKPFYKTDDNAPSSAKFLEIIENSKAEDYDLRRLLFGETCFHCGVHYREKTLTVHRKDGRRHGKDILKRKKHLRVMNPDEWISLCQKCHRETHWAMDTLLMNWKELADLKQRE